MHDREDASEAREQVPDHVQRPDARVPRAQALLRLPDRVPGRNAGDRDRQARARLPRLRAAREVESDLEEDRQPEAVDKDLVGKQRDVGRRGQRDQYQRGEAEAAPARGPASTSKALGRARRPLSASRLMSEVSVAALRCVSK